MMFNAEPRLKSNTSTPEPGSPITSRRREEPAALIKGAARPPEPEDKIVHKEVRNKRPNVCINIRLQIPEVDDTDVYDRFFKAMKDNLFPDD